MQSVIPDYLEEVLRNVASDRTGELAGRLRSAFRRRALWLTPGEVRVLQLQGGIRFVGAERIDREVVDTAPSEPRVVFDLTMVSSIDDVARRMLLEVARRS